LAIDDGQLDGIDGQLRALWAAINKAMASGNYPPRPGRLCDWCSYQNICPAFADVALAEGQASV
jgi:putative RecB family exonuclease